MQPNSDNGVNNGTVPVSNAVPAAGGVVNPNVAAQRNDMKSVPVPEKPKKKSNAMMLGMIIFALLAAGGIGFGVWAMLDGNAQVAKKDEQIKDLKSQISNLNDEISNMSTVVEDELNGDTALDLLQEASVGKQLGYGVGYANVHAKCENDGKVSYWVQYANGHRDSEDVPQFGNIMFEMGDDGTWQFELPGFTGYTEETVANCTILHGNK